MQSKPTTTTTPERPSKHSLDESGSPELFVEVHLYNRPGIYRVLTIGGNGRKDSDMDAARILRKLAHWVETKEQNEQDRADNDFDNHP